jgi:hypothetical protein
MPRELVLADYVSDDGLATQANRDGFLALLSDLKGMRRRHLYVPVPSTPGARYRIPITAADKMTDNDRWVKGEQGDILIARFLVDSDLCIYGDDALESVIELVIDDPELPAALLKVSQPYSLKLKDVQLTCARPTQGFFSGYRTQSMGVYCPPRTGNPTGKHYLTTENAKVDGFSYGLFVTGGPTTSINHLEMKLTGGEIRGHVHAVTCWSDSNADGTKSIRAEGVTLRSSKTVGVGSHVLYVHPNVHFRARDLLIDDWLSAKYGLAHWGGSGADDGQPRSATALWEGVRFGAGGEGVGMITSASGSAQANGCVFECRQAIQVRKELLLSNSFITPKPTVDGTISCISTFNYPGATIQVNGLHVDLSHIGSRNLTVFDLQNSLAEWNIANVRVVSRARTQGATLFGSASGLGAGYGLVRAKNVHFHAYHASDLEYADPAKRSTAYFAALRQGNLYTEGCSFSGDASHDRGAVRLDFATNVGVVDLTGLEIDAQRGMALYTDASSAGKVRGRAKLKSGRLNITSGSQALRFGEEMAPADLVAADTLVIGTDHGVLRVVRPAGATAPVVIRNILVNGRAVDTAAYAGATLELVGDLGWEFGAGGNVDVAPGARAVVRLRLDAARLVWVQA